MRGRLSRLAPEAAGIAGLAVLALAFARLGNSDLFLYRGGFAVTSLATAVVIFAAVQPRLRISRLMGLTPLRWVGLRPYGIYLWHCPIFMQTRPDVDVPFDGATLVALHMALTLATAELSHRLIEVPVRAGIIARFWAGLRNRSHLQLWPRLRMLSVAGAMAVSVVLLAACVLGAESSPRPALPARRPRRDRPWERDYEQPHRAVRRTAAPSPTPEETPAPAPAHPCRPSRRPARSVAPIATPNPPLPVPSPPPPPAYTGRAFAFGDSVMLGATDYLGGSIPGLAFDAEVRRQSWTAIDVLRSCGRRSAGRCRRCAHRPQRYLHSAAIR